MSIKNAIHSVYSFFKTFARLIEAALDVVFFLLICTSVIISSIVLERGVRFDLGEGYVAYFTVGTFFSTYSRTYPVCVDEDPSAKIRAALAMMYLALFLLAISTQLSVRAFRYEMRLRERTNQEAALTYGKKSRGEIEQGIRADEVRGARSLVAAEECEDDIEEVTL